MAETHREAHLQIETPAAMRTRPVDHRGFPVPWFVTEKTPDGRWDFTRVTEARMQEAVRQDRCWVSGQKLGRYKAFIIGPMCAINRTGGDPPVTREIAHWSVRVCPFMSRPRARRADHSEGGVAPHGAAGIDGVAILRNPGVAGIWVSETSEFQRGRGFYLGDPVSVSWWCEGRPATRAEVLASVESGIHQLEDLARQDGAMAMRALERHRRRAEPLWPQEGRTNG